MTFAALSRQLLVRTTPVATSSTTTTTTRALDKIVLSSLIRPRRYVTSCPSHQGASLSTSALQVEDDDVLDTSSSSDGTSSQPLLSSASRNDSKFPRLQALRKQLQQEGKNDNRLNTLSSSSSSSSSSCSTTITNANDDASMTILQTTSHRTLSTVLLSGKSQLRQWFSNPSHKPQTREEWQALVNHHLPDMDRSTVQQQQSSSLMDSYGRHHKYLRLSLTERCNLRCTYCMPVDGVPLSPPSHLLQTDELLQLAQFFAQQGVTKFRLTGGEPTLRNDLTHIIQGLADNCAPQQIGMTSNGIVGQWDDYIDKGLNSLNLSLDTLHPETFAQLTRRPAKYLHRVLETLQLTHSYCTINDTTSYPPQQDQHNDNTTAASRKKPFVLKVNCVVMRGINDHEVIDFIRLLEEYPYLQVRFIEYMPFTANGWQTDRFVPYQELLQTIQEQGLQLYAVPSDDVHDTTKWFSTIPPPSNDTTGRPHRHHRRRQIGFITSMSAPFCAGCNRLRLTADGQIKVCLFDSKTEVSLRDALRVGHLTHHQLSKLVAAVVQTKHASLGGHASPQAISDDADQNRPMTLIGG